MSAYHRPLRGQQTPPSDISSHSRRDEEEQGVIDPNLYGPFGHRYHESTTSSAHVHSDRPVATSWHNVETTEQLQQHDSQQQPQQDQVDIPLRPMSTHHATASQAGLVPNAAPMALEYSQDSRYSLASATHEKLGSHQSSYQRYHSSSVNTNRRSTYAHSRAGSLFDIVHGKQPSSQKPHIEVHAEDLPINLRHLFKRPLVRQWLHGNKLYREKDERKPSQFELVFDLIFVAVVNGLGHATAESSSAINVLKFVLSFWPCFSIWTDVRLFLNVSGTDDVLERLLLLGWMILLGGYCANISGVELVKATPELLAQLRAEEHQGDAPLQLIQHSLAGELESIFKRATGGGGGSEAVKLAAPAFGGYWFNEGYDRAIHAAIGFFLVSKLWRLAIYIYYGFALPKFRKAIWSNALAMTVIAAIYIPITLTSWPLLIVLLMSAGILVELARAYVVAAAIKLFHGRAKHSGEHMFIPAQSHEHSIERYILFVILIIGESIISSNFIARPGTFGVNAEFGRAALGISISFLVIWIYYDADGSRVFQHALRRNSFTSITFGHIHYPLTASLVLMAASLSSLISKDKINGGYVWYFGGSLSCIMLCLALIGCLHKNLDVYRSTLVPRSLRIAARFGAAIEFGLLPLKKDWNSLTLMGTVTGSLALLVLFETVGKIGAVGRRFDPAKTQEMYHGMQQRGTKKLKLDKRASWHPFDDLTPGEKGEEDVGIESEIGHLEEKDLTYGQRWAFCA